MMEHLGPDEVEFTKKQQLQFKKLIEAVLLLEKRFKKEAEYKAADKKNDFTYKGFIKNLVGAGSRKSKDMLSVRGVGGMLGVKEHTVLGQLLAARHDSKVEKQEREKDEAKKAHEYAKNYTQFTAEGRKEYSKDEVKALEKGVILYKKQYELEKSIFELEEKRTKARELLGRHADLGEEDIKTLRSKKAELSKMHRPVQDVQAQGIKQSGTVISPTTKGKYIKTEGVWRNEIGQKIPEEFTGSLEKLLNGVDTTMKKQGEVSSEILKTLKGKQVDAGIEEEKTLEGKEKPKVNILEKVKKANPLASATSSLLDYVGNFKSMLEGVTKGAEVLISSVRVLGVLLANPVVLAGIGALVAAGSILKLISDEKVKPGEKSTLEGAASANDASAEFKTITEANGDQTPEEIRKANDKEQEQLKDAPWYTRLYGIGKEKYLKENKPSSIASIPPAPIEKNTDELIKNRIELESKINETNQAKMAPTQQTNINSTKVDNNVNITKVVPPVRNIEPSYNSRLNRSFA